jgi:UPF0271 protein
METNLNCDLGETSIQHSAENDSELMKLINTANIACGFHAGDELTMKKTVDLAIKHNVSIGAHPGFADKENFGRKRVNLTKNEIKKLILDQIQILSEISESRGLSLTHVKPHGALNNMACEDYELSFTIGQTIKEFNRELIFMVLPETEMEKAGKDLDLKIACEIFADRNYEDNGRLVSRDQAHALKSDVIEATQNIINMLNDRAILCYSGKRIPCQIDTICVHGDGENAIDIVRNIKKNLEKAGLIFKPLSK